WTGMLYVGYNLAVYPAALFTARRQNSLKQTLLGGLIAGVLMTVPWFLTYFSLMGFYPSEEGFTADVPWLEMLSGYGVWVVIAFGVVVGWTLIVTASWLVRAFLDRVNFNLGEVGKPQLSKGRSGLFAIIALLLSAILSSVGIGGLVDFGYAVLGYAMLIIYGIPMLIIGSYKIIKALKGKKADTEADNSVSGK